ncbi:glycosyltransferase family 2 protein [Phaeodactylibacter xiamenensis]|uniref:glycosyltransferase family 2 protein n=1 Tax=Phaeodactylibacter xiamenensis TaxID=1524460 RepID=UPI003CCC08B4
MPASGLSILIPVYNYDVRPLVEALRQQADALEWAVEILCWDDASLPEFQNINAPLGQLPGVTYRLMPENLGRSRIRNRLAEAARYDYLLFMDGDSEVTRADYLEQYQSHCTPGRLLYGGRIYQPEPPESPRLRFHWHYGRSREVQRAETRQKQPYHSFMTNNFLIPKALFAPIQFDERLLQYGHEDTLFGLELQRRGIPILHLDNPLIHAGLEPAETFLRKSEQAIENLVFLYQEGSLRETRLLRAYERLDAWKAARPARYLLDQVRPLLKQHLLYANTPNLRAFDLYKLGVLLHYLCN